MVGKRDTLIRIHMPPGSSHWEGNIAFASHHAVVARSRIEGVRELDPRLSRTGDLWRPSETSPVVDAATGSFPSVVSDVDGQLRVGDKDVGADEVSTLRAGNRPLSGADVGPAAP
jgi:poly(beta-D-mannuronate) lyase